MASITEILTSKEMVVGVVGIIVGLLGTLITTQWLNRRSRFRYSVLHNRIGVSTEDSVFGSVKVTWNERETANLFLSVVKLVNESARDYENIEVTVHTADTNLLTQKVDIAGSTRSLEFTQEFRKKIFIPKGGMATEDQKTLYASQRSYLIPIMNRGQEVRFAFLNDARSTQSPVISLDILHKGVKLEFGVEPNKIFGVSQPRAAWVGMTTGLLAFVVVINLVQTLWIAALILFFYGLFAQVPGALLIKSWCWFKSRWH